jgi:TrmH family RNA methyltransferase
MNRRAHTKDIISSLQNPKVKQSVLLHKSRERKRQKMFLVEGKQELERALIAGYTLSKVFICEDIFDMDIPVDLEVGAGSLELHYVTPRVYASMAYRKESEGIIGIAQAHDHRLEKLRLSARPLILVVDAVEKPGNLGAILRTADAAGIDALIVSDVRTDVYNPNVVRSSLGAVFTTQIGIGTAQDVIRWLKANHINVYCTALSASRSYVEIDYTCSAAIVLGTENTGLPEIWLSQSDQNIIIPMHGTVDSMNVSVSAGIVLFEAVRQRGK